MWPATVALVRPHGIQQAAVSGQMGRLEKDLGVRLCERQPFRLTSAGNERMEFVAPFFSNIAAVKQRRRGSPQLRISASAGVPRLHLPVVLERLRHAHPRLRLGLRSGFDTELAAGPREGQVDLIVTPRPDGRVP